jgi:hypothetical protein
MKSLFAFFARHAWIFVVLAFAILIAKWATVITIAVKHSPQQIEWKKPAQVHQ